MFCFLFEVHVITLKTFPTRKLRSKYNATPLKYTKDILWAFFVVFNAFVFKLLSINVNWVIFYLKTLFMSF